MLNLFDSSASVGVVILDPDSDDTFALGEYHLESLQVTSQAVIPARYLFHFYLAAGFHIAQCVIDIADGEQVQFVIVESGVVIATADEPDGPAKVGVASRCQAEEV